MNKIIIFGIISIIVIVSVSLSFLVLNTDDNESISKVIPDEITNFTLTQKGEGQKIFLPKSSPLFNTYYYHGDILGSGEQGRIFVNHRFFELNPEHSQIYQELSNKNNPQESVVIIPLFTITAYGKPGFYDFFKKTCDEKCINSIPIRHDLTPIYETSDNGIKILQLLDYQFITDVEVDKHPEILKKFDKIILLHNEYVTKKMFDAITQHPKVVYLYPNALYAEITVDYDNDEITLVRGHGFPSPEIRNGFDWEFDNTHPFESDYECNNWEFYEIDNGIMLNCYPENIISKDKELLKSIKDY